VYHRTQDSILVCNDVNGLMEEVRFQHDSEERRIFICVSKIKLKTVFLHNGLVKSPIPFAHPVAKKEIFLIMPLLLNAFNYNNHC
jgi:hypothetical protein